MMNAIKKIRYKGYLVHFCMIFGVLHVMSQCDAKYFNLWSNYTHDELYSYWQAMQTTLGYLVMFVLPLCTLYLSSLMTTYFPIKQPNTTREVLIYWGLYRITKHYLALIIVAFGTVWAMAYLVPDILVGISKTPSEAVAMLWLALDSPYGLSILFALMVLSDCITLIMSSHHPWANLWRAYMSVTGRYAQN